MSVQPGNSTPCFWLVHTWRWGGGDSFPPHNLGAALGSGWWQVYALVSDSVSLLTSLALARGVCSWQGGAWTLGANILAVCPAETRLSRV